MIEAKRAVFIVRFVFESTKKGDKMSHPVLKAEKRTHFGKGFARKLRKESKVPAVVYGKNEEPASISIDFKEINNIMQTEHRLFNLTVDKKEQLVLIKDVQFGPVKDFPIHVDFLRLKEKVPFKFDIPVHLTNSDLASGVRKGGKLQHIIHKLHIETTLETMPEHYDIDVIDLDNLESVKIKDVKIDGVKILNPPNASIVNITKARTQV